MKGMVVELKYQSLWLKPLTLKSGQQAKHSTLGCHWMVVQINDKKKYWILEADLIYSTFHWPSYPRWHFGNPPERVWFRYSLTLDNTPIQKKLNWHGLHAHRRTINEVLLTSIYWRLPRSWCPAMSISFKSSRNHHGDHKMIMVTWLMLCQVFGLIEPRGSGCCSSLSYSSHPE